MSETGWIARPSSSTAASTRSSRCGEVSRIAQAAVRFTLALATEPMRHDALGPPSSIGNYPNAMDRRNERSNAFSVNLTRFFHQMAL